jgi:tRNA threonylcarbamoyladenosine modification (KEOPS) complex  Pcc1 subunit
LKKVLFVCVENAGRSQMAEAFANYYGKGKLVASSAGIMLADSARLKASNVENSRIKAKASILIKFKSKKQLDSIFKALEPEIHAPVSNRSKVIMKKDRNALNLIFEAQDTSALRAAINSYLHWILLTREVLESLETF